MFEKRRDVMARLDRWREVLLHEPRGYPCANADFLVIAEQAKVYPLMSGHNTICVATALVECGLLPADRRERFVLEAPSGPVPIRTELAADGRCASVTFDGPPSFVAVRDEVVQLDPDACRAIGLAAAEVCPQAADLGLAIDARDGARLRAAGELVKAAARAQCPVQHPTFDYPGPDIMAFRGPWRRGAVATNTVVMSNGYSGMLDRSPCGSGTCAIMALLHARGELDLGERFVHESVVGSVFTGELVGVTAEGVVPAITRRLIRRAPRSSSTDRPAAKLDEEALTIVAEMASAAAEARGRELQLAAAPGAPRGHRASVCRALRTLRSLATLRVRVDAYDLQRGFYGVRVAIPVDGGASRTIVVKRSWRDLLKLRKGLAKRLPPVAAASLKKLPRARPLSTLKRSVRNLAGAGKGDRKWQRSKLPQVDAWLRGAVGVVAREASRAGRIDAEEFLEDFLFAYGTVADAEEA
ncbi:unnamed protein product [Pelagomonas calceolata]|uniref:Uncharacterized protein n=1 Tax=Pelagomonas calceolata TaxID=35677 RepID=A0A8J2SVS3_9STRA|nr:unnamed protein product [Pelagomonas calceolata]